MPRAKPRGEYTADWPDVAKAAKDAAGWRCERCRHVHDYDAGYVLTVHHLDGDKGNNAAWNLAVLCQRCHLSIQGKVDMAQGWMLEHTPWMLPHVEGYLAATKKALGLAQDGDVRGCEARQGQAGGEAAG